MQKKAPIRSGFFQSIADRLQSRRLGELLLHSGLISEDQLQHALDVQKESRAQLGRILIEQGAVSSVSLYKKLSEQWCLKFCTAAISLMMGVISYAPSSARAQSTPTVTEISATVNAAGYVNPVQEYPQLFGTREIKSDDVSSFSKWSEMLKRFEQQLYVSTPSTDVELWKGQIRRLQGEALITKIVMINQYVNNIQYISDASNWNKSDYWATPIEFFSRGGDCEDYAIAKYASLIALGVPHENMRLAIVHDKIKDIPHAVLIVYTEEGTFVLDNQNKKVRLAHNVNRYRPIFSLNQNNWWLHRA